MEYKETFDSYEDILRESKNNNNPHAHYHLAIMYLFGDSVRSRKEDGSYKQLKIRLKSAIKYFNKASSNNLEKVENNYFDGKQFNWNLLKKDFYNDYLIKLQK